MEEIVKVEHNVKSIIDKEMISIETEYKELIEALRKETHDKTKAESSVEVLKDLVKSEEELNAVELVVEGSEMCEEMEVDEYVGVWINQQKRKSVKIPTELSKTYQCDECNFVSRKESYLRQHAEIHTQQEKFKCNACKAKFDTKN